MKPPGHIRIIGGQWKSRRVRCAQAPGLRPSADAVRETLFNWLPHHLHLKSCLDLFAGSGALGFEAASRGAAQVKMVEANSRVCELLRWNCAMLRAENIVEIFPLPVEKFLQRYPAGFDIIFMDPPFGSHAIARTCETLRQRNFFNPAALLYIESKHADGRLPMPADWHILRQKRCGMVLSTLLQT